MNKTYLVVVKCNVPNIPTVTHITSKESLAKKLLTDHDGDPNFESTLIESDSISILDFWGITHPERVPN